MQAKFDCIIVGGGLVGSALANLLQTLNWQVALVDPTQVKSHGKTDSPLVSAVNLQSQSLLADIGVWESLKAEHKPAFNRMAVFDNSGGGKLTFNGPEAGYSELGFIVTNQALQYQLRNRFINQGGELFVPVKAEAVVKNEQWCVHLSERQPIEAPLLIAADGGNSWLRQQMGIECWEWSYHQQALVATLQTEKPHGSVARQWFHPSGILAFLPLADPHKVAIVWSLKEENAQKIAEYSHARLCQRLQAITADQLGELKLISQRYQRPLAMRHAKVYVKPGFSVVGDAAHTIHPLAGQGVNLGLRDVAALVSVLRRAQEKRRDVAAYDTLRQYERARKGDAWLFILTMEAFRRGFVNESNWLAWLRSQGLRVVDCNQLLKRFFIHEASGG